MEARAKLLDASRSLNGDLRMTFSVKAKPEVVEQLHGKELRLTALEWREKRSLDANGLLWVCIGKIASALNTDKWEIYLLMLRRYGKFTYIVVPPGAVESMKQMWRETEVVGEIDVNGRKATQLLCYFGSSTYDTLEFSKLLNGVISEMKEMGIPTPEEEDMDRVLKEWEKRNAQKHNAES